MQELDKILEEINAEFDRRIRTQLKITAGLSDDVYRYGYGKSLEAYQQGKLFVTDIIRKHLSRENTTEIARSSRDNDGWISVEERLPEDDRMVLVTCQTKKGIRSVNRAYCDGAFWHGSGSMSGVIAWRPLPEPYRPERSAKE